MPTIMGTRQTISSPVNPGFEDDNGVTASPSGWTLAGALDAVYTERGGHSGFWHLTHHGNTPFHIETSQTLEGLTKDWYTLRVWVRSSGRHNGAYIAIRDYGKSEVRTHLPVTSEWIQIVVSTQVTRGRCTISLVSDGNAGNWANFDDVEFVPGRAQLSVRGADISSLFKSEACGGVYRTEDGEAQDALTILQSKGMNWARLRLWVDPADGYHDKAELLQMAKRLRHNRMDLLVDFHYSDTWADPGKQIKPAAWRDLAFHELQQAVYDHTYDVCHSLKKQRTIPAMVQIGNELNAGMLWPDGHTWDPPNWDHLAQLLTAGYEAVKACSQTTRVMIHLANGGDNDLYHWWFDEIEARGVPYDLIGASYYPNLHGSLAELQFNLNDITARYDKDVIVVEYAYPFTLEDADRCQNLIYQESDLTQGYPATPHGQAAMLRDVMSIIRAVPNGRGLGVMYWDATWTAVPGNGWDPDDPDSGNECENRALFDYKFQALPALDQFQP